MTTNGCAPMVERAISRLRDGFVAKPYGAGCRLITPLLRRDGDSFEVTVEPTVDGFLVHDEGESLDYLQLSGIGIRGNRSFERLVTEVQSAHRVLLSRGALTAKVTDESQVGDAVVRILAAMNDITQFELTRRERPPETFDSLVEGELVGLGLPYDTGVVKKGATRDRAFAFGIDSQRNTVIQPLTAGSSHRAVEVADVLIVSTLDVWRIDKTLGAIAIVDDKRNVWEDRALPDLLANGLTVVRWSRRHSEMLPAVTEPRRGVALTM
jgi:hypothetical protein